MDVRKLKERIIKSGYKAVEELVKVAEEKILDSIDMDSDIGPEKLKVAAQAKKTAIFDAFEILTRITAEEELMNLGDGDKKRGGLAEHRAK